MRMPFWPALRTAGLGVFLLMLAGACRPPSESLELEEEFDGLETEPLSLTDSLPGLQKTGNNYSFALFADPQLAGNRKVTPANAAQADDAHRTYSRAIQDANAQRPAFMVVNGDFINDPKVPTQWGNFVRLTKQSRSQVVLVHGNHDGHPPYSQYLKAARLLKSPRRLFYSFNAGKWHYIAIPVFPHDGANSEEFLTWLANDLAANRTRPTMVFAHYHFMPQGLTQLEYYAQTPLSLRQRILHEVLKHGNVRYWFAGHVHNGVKSSIKIAWEHRGCKFITVPTGTAPRNFGEEFPAFRKGMTEGGYYLMVNVKGDDVSIVGRRAGQPQAHRYPNSFRAFDPALDPRWLKRAQDFSPTPFSNGGFEQALAGWYPVWRYKADQKPGFVAEVTSQERAEGASSLHIKVREKGQTWAFDELNEVFQVFAVPPGQRTQLSLNYNVGALSRVGGGYVRVHGYQGTQLVSTMVFYFGHNGIDKGVTHTGKIFCLTGEADCTSLAGFRTAIEAKKIMFWELGKEPGRWHTLKVDLNDLHDRSAAAVGRQATFAVDKMFLAVGVWNGKVPGSESDAYFDAVNVSYGTAPQASVNDGRTLPADAGVFTPRFLGDLR